MPETPVVIVSGASRGLGAATARWLAKAGAAITLLARSTDALAAVTKDVQQLGGAFRLESIPGDGTIVSVSIPLPEPEPGMRTDP